jgi:HK97 family phage major capsid protein
MPELPSNIKEKLDELSGNVQKIMGDLEPRIKAAEESGKGAAELKEEVDKISKRNGEIVDDLEKFKKELEKRQDEHEATLQGKLQNGAFGQKSAAELFAEQVKEKGLKIESNKDRFSVDVPTAAFMQKDITNLSGSAGQLLIPQYRAGLIDNQYRTPRIVDLIRVLNTTSTTIYFFKENVVTDGVSVQVSQGDIKGESNITYTRDSEEVLTIAHWIKLSRQMLDDVSYLQGQVNGRLRLLLELEEENQVLNGSGTNELNGINTQATAYDVSLETTTGVSDQQNIDRIRVAMLQVALAFYPPTGIVLHPTDWAGIELEKDANKQYLFTQPQDGTAPRMWGMPVIPTTAQTQDEFTVGAWNLGAELYRRENITVRISSENEDDFIRNMVTMLAEMREALVVVRPDSFVYGTFSET